MSGVVESNELPEGGDGGFSSFTVISASSPRPTPSADEVAEMADRLRFMGLSEDTAIEYERRLTEDFGAAIRWLQDLLQALPRRRRWVCDCGATLLDDEWHGQATVRCGTCGARWGIEARSGGTGRQWSVDGPSDEWLAAHPPEVEDPYGEHDPVSVITNGLPPLVDGIPPGTGYPIATWVHGSIAAVLYAYRQLPGEFDLPGDEYGNEIEHLTLDPDEGWMNNGSGGGNWINPFAPPTALLDKYVVLGTGVSGTSDGETDLHVTGGYCSSAVAAVELEEEGERTLVPVDPTRRAFVVGTTARQARLRFLGADGRPLADRGGASLEWTLGGDR